MEKKIPKFQRQNRAIKGRISDAWRKPRGIDNKMRMRRAGTGAVPRIGYRTARKQRGLHPSGLREKLVSNEKELALAKGFAVRISAKVGAKKKAAVVRKARELGLKVLNG